MDVFSANYFPRKIKDCNQADVKKFKIIACDEVKKVQAVPGYWGGERAASVPTA